MHPSIKLPSGLWGLHLKPNCSLPEPCLAPGRKDMARRSLEPQGLRVGPRAQGGFSVGMLRWPCSFQVVCHEGARQAEDGQRRNSPGATLPLPPGVSVSLRAGARWRRPRQEAPGHRWLRRPPSPPSLHSPSSSCPPPSLACSLSPPLLQAPRPLLRASPPPPSALRCCSCRRLQLPPDVGWAARGELSRRLR